MKSFPVLTLFAWEPVSFRANFYVSPDGNDTHPGTTSQPFATVQRPRWLPGIPRLIKESVTVNLAPGVYELNQKLVFTREDSGISEEAPVRYMSTGGGEVVLSGGSRLNLNWEKDAGIQGVWKAKVELKEGKRFEQLWVNGKRAVRARTPDYWTFARLLGVNETDIPGKERKLHTFKIDPAIAGSLQGLSEQELKDVQIHVIHKWDTTREWLTSADPVQGVLTAEGTKMQPHNMMVRDSLYYLENSKSALNAPGEWFLDRDGWLYYHPLEGEDVTTSEFIYPRLESLLEVAGEKGRIGSVSWSLTTFTSSTQNFRRLLRAFHRDKRQ